MNTRNHLLKTILGLIVVYLLSSCNTPLLSTETAFNSTNTPIATQTIITTNTSTSEPTATLQSTISVPISIDLPPLKKLIVSNSNTPVEILGEEWVSFDRGGGDNYAWITLGNSTSNDQLTQVVAYLNPNEDRTALFGDYPTGSIELEVENNLVKYNGLLKIIGFQNDDSTIIFVELQIETHLYGVQLVTDNSEAKPLDDIYNKDLRELSEYLIEDSIGKESLAITPVPSDSQEIYAQAEKLLLETNLEGWLYEYDNAESAHVCRYFENAIPYGVKVRTLLNCMYNTSYYDWNDLQEMADYFTLEGDEIIGYSENDTRFTFGYFDGRVFVSILYFDSDVSFAVTFGFAQLADIPSDLYGNESEEYLNFLLSQNIEKLEGSR